ncbi:transmembrane protein, putative [Medicago truncatula]|uniref:Transmembrane protein, putative n=1 Tax=Medicago truncatula TaxID=3880 RepID=G7L3G2_MEDTR|nr:transmembrane protein, putative [Medicago truncatula]
MAFSFYQSFLFLILCIALVLPSGLAITKDPNAQCVASCVLLPKQCPIFCKTRGYKRGGQCQFYGKLNLCCCFQNPP